MRFAAALLYAVATAVLVALGLAFAQGGLRTGAAFSALGCGVGVAACALWRQRIEPIAWPRPGVWDWLAIAAFALFALRAFLWLVFTDGDAIEVLSPNNLGDLSLHLTFIPYLASGVAFWPENPICTGSPLVYPIGADLFNSLLLLAGVDPLRGLVWVGLGGAALTGAALWRWGRAFALAGFLANGGLMGFAFFGTWEFEDFQAELAWKSLPLALLVTQRGLLFALPAGLLLLASWRARFFDGDPRDRLPWTGELLLYAAMPVFHLHTFLFLSLLLAAWFVSSTGFQPVGPAGVPPAGADGCTARRRDAPKPHRLEACAPPLRRALAVFIAAALVPAGVLTLLVTGKMRGASVLGWKPGWMWDDAPWVDWCAAHLQGPPPLNAALLFWPMNFGVLPVLVAALCWQLWRTDRTARAFVFPALAVFLLCCFVKFAPWEWDNTKLMVWSYLAVLPFLWRSLLAPWPWWARAAMCFLLFWSGFASLIGGLDATHTGYEIARRSELDGVAQAVHALPRDARFAGHPTYNHPLLLAGRKMALGYPGHLWSHGLPWQEAAPKLEALMNGDPAWRALAGELGVRYIFFGDAELEHYPASTQPWKSDAALVASGDWGEIYKVVPGFSPSNRPARDTE